MANQDILCNVINKLLTFISEGLGGSSMLTSMDRLTIYAVLCFISFCTIVLTSSNDMGIFAIGGLFPAALGLWFELTSDAELEEES